MMAAFGIVCYFAGLLSGCWLSAVCLECQDKPEKVKLPVVLRILMGAALLLLLFVSPGLFKGCKGTPVDMDKANEQWLRELEANTNRDTTGLLKFPVSQPQLFQTNR